MFSVTRWPIASAFEQPIVCSTNFSDTTQMRRSPSSSRSQRPASSGVSPSSSSSTARFTPLTLAVMVVPESPYLSSVALPTCSVFCTAATVSGKAAMYSSTMASVRRSLSDGLESINSRSATPPPKKPPEESSSLFCVRLTVMLDTPSPLMESVTAPVMLLPIVSMAMTAAMPMMMPSMVSRLRILLARRLPSASTMFSKNPTAARPLSLCHNAPVQQREHPAAFFGQVLVVGDEYDGLVVTLVHFAEQVHDDAAGLAVQRAGGFVGQDDGRVARDGHALLLPAGQLIGLVFHAFAHAHAPEPVGRAARARGPARLRRAWAARRF